MAFVIALAFVLAVFLASLKSMLGYVWALLLGLGMGAWLTALIDARIRRGGREPRRQDAAADTEAVFAALEDIHWRLKRLEEARGLGPSPLEAARQAAEAEAGTAAAPPATGPDQAAADAGPAVPAIMASAVEATPAAEASAAAVPDLAAAPPPAAHAPAGGQPATSSYRAPATPAAPSLLARAQAWLLGGNTVVRTGIVVLFFGVSFLLKFAIDRAILPLELRVAGVGAGAIVLLGIGWHLRQRRAAYALALQGAGVGMLYLTLFGAFRLYQLLPAGVALAALVAVAGLSALIALLQNSAALMSIGVTGGFLAPLLASTSSGNHVALFSYYLALNLGIFAVAWFRAWRPLNLLGFFFTAAIGLLWGTQRYEPALFASTEPFLVIFFLLYLAISVLFALRQDPGLGAWASELGEGRLPRRVVDGTLVFGLPLLAFGFQAGMLHDTDFGLAYTALALSALYLALARWLQDRAGVALLAESFVALGVIFATLAIPLALDARWTAASWAVEGAALVWVGLRQQHRAARRFGVLLQLAAAVAWMLQSGSWDASQPVLANGYCLGAFLIGGAGLFSAWQLQRGGDTVIDRILLLFGWGLGWWLLAGLGEAHRHLGQAGFHAFAALYLALNAALFHAVAPRLQWPQGELPAAGLAPALALTWLSASVSLPHAFAGAGAAALPAAFLILCRLRWRQDQAGVFPSWRPVAHGLAYWLLALAGSAELHWLAGHLALAGGWQVASAVIVPATLLFAVSAPGNAARWPVRQAPAAYLGWGAAPVLSALALWVLLADLTSPADPAPLPWLPLLNPVDLAHVLLGLAVFAWVRRLRGDAGLAELLPTPRQGAVVTGLLTFHWLNAVLLRTLHHWTGIAYEPGTLLDSTLVQAALSLFWTVLALILMASAARRSLRMLWMVGAGLMAVVVLKLFLVDLDRVGSVARIVSFLGVGLLMLLIGYLAPVPPKAAAPEA